MEKNLKQKKMGLKNQLKLFLKNLQLKLLKRKSAKFTKAPIKKVNASAAKKKAPATHSIKGYTVDEYQKYLHLKK